MVLPIATVSFLTLLTYSKEFLTGIPRTLIINNSRSGRRQFYPSQSEILQYEKNTSEFNEGQIDSGSEFVR